MEGRPHPDCSCNNRRQMAQVNRGARAPMAVSRRLALVPMGVLLLCLGAAHAALAPYNGCVRNSLSSVTISCQLGYLVTSFSLASYGTPTGSCASSVALSVCNSPNSLSVISYLCTNQRTCTVFNNVNTFGGDPCSGQPTKYVAANWTCGFGTSGTPRCME